MRDQSLHILQHALGLDDFGRGTSYRNHYVCGEDCDSWPLLVDHVNAGRMTRHGPREVFGGSYCFVVTEAGREYVRSNSPVAPKPSPSKRRYQRFLDADSGLSFGEWMKREGADRG